MSIKIMTRVWEESKQGGSQLLLLLAIADNANDGGFAWPSQDHLAKKVRMNRRTIPRLTAKLHESGELFINDRSDKGKVTHYVVLTGMSWAKFADTLQNNLKYNRAEIIKVRDWFDARGGDDKLSGLTDCRADTAMSGGVDTAMSTEPSLTVNEPPLLPQGGDGDFSDLFPEPLQADSTIRKLDDNGKAHLLTFGVLPSDEIDPKEHEVRQELLSADWQIHSPDVELAIVYFVLAVRAHHPDFAIPNDDGTRKDWYKSVAAHLKNHPLSELQNLYKLAIIKMIDKDLSYWRPGSLTRWAIPEVANEPVLTQGPQITDEDKAARDYLDSLEGKPLPD